MSDYNDTVKNDALELFLEVKSLSRVSEIMGIPYNTLNKWKIKYNWERELKKQDSLIVADSVDLAKTVDSLCEKFNIPVNDGEILKQVKTIEKICMKSIKNKYSEDDQTLRPLTFDGAVKTLKICWDTRLKIFPKATGNGDEKKDKISYIANVHHHYGKEKNEANTVSDLPKESMVSGLLSNRERIRDREPE